MKLTQSQVDRYVKEKGNHCPFDDCRSHTLSCECVFDGEEGIEKDVKCRRCGRQFTEHYRIISLTLQEPRNDPSEPTQEAGAGSK